MEKRQKLNEKSSKLEFTMYVIAYISMFSYGLWMIGGASREILQKYPNSTFVPTIINTTRDANPEFELFGYFLVQTWHCFISHLIVTTSVRLLWPAYQSCAHILITLFYMQIIFSLKSALQFGILLIMYYLAACIRSKFAVWLITFGWLLFFEILLHNESYGSIKFYYYIYACSWSLLRCTSYCLDYINDYNGALKDIERYTLVNYLGYILYFPCLIFGPVTAFHHYIKSMSSNSYKCVSEDATSFTKDLITLLNKLLRLMFLWLLLYTISHTFYIYFMLSEISAVELIDNTFGKFILVYFFGTCFGLFYKFTYGLSIAIGNFDNLNPPTMPCCVNYAQFYSDLWKYFDSGLYYFLFKYIYSPIHTTESSVARRIFAICTTFIFVFVWHGSGHDIFIWTLLNFICLMFEKYYRKLFTLLAFRNFFGDNFVKHLYAIIGSQLFQFQTFGSMYLMTHSVFSNYMMKTLFTSGIWNYFCISFFYYCCFQISKFINTTFICKKEKEANRISVSI